MAGDTAGTIRIVVVAAAAAAVVVAVSEAAEAVAVITIIAAAGDEEEGREEAAAAAAAEEVRMEITGRSTKWAMLAAAEEEEEAANTDKGARFRTCSLRMTTVGIRARVRVLVWSRGRTTLLFCREVGCRSGTRMGLGLGMEGRVLGWDYRIIITRMVKSKEDCRTASLLPQSSSEPVVGPTSQAVYAGTQTAFAP